MFSLPVGLRVGAIILEDTRENLVDVAQLPLQIEGVLDLLARNPAGDLFVFQDQFVEIQIFFPGAHGVLLHQSIRVFARDAMLDQIEQQLSAEDQAAVLSRLRFMRSG